MTKKLVCAIHCTPKERKKVITLGNKVGGGLKNNPLVFAAPVPWTGTLILTETGTLETLDAAAAHGSELDVSKADEQAEKVYNMVHDDMHYTDGIANGVESVIRLAGYDPIEEPVKKVIPNQPVIKQAIDGREEHSAKLVITSCEVRAMHIVEQCELPGTEWKPAMQTTNSHNLVVKNLTHAKDYQFRVSDQNAAGKSAPSAPINFLAR